MNAPTLFDAIQAAEDHADDRWRLLAQQSLARFIATGRPFTTDELWAELDDLDAETHEPRALGAIIRRASRDGLITAVGYQPSTRSECHGRPIRVWRSTVACHTQGGAA